MPETDDTSPALDQTIEGRRNHTRSKTMDDMTGYGSKRGYGRRPDNDGDADDRRGYGTPAGKADDDDGDEGFAGQASDVTKHPQIDHNGHRKDSPGQCVGCGSPRCMGGCGSGCKRM